MNKKVSVIGCTLNIISVATFALFMLVKWNNGCYFSSMFIAFSFVVMMASFCNESGKDNKVAAYSSIIFSAIYVTLILIVYFAQLTTVRLENMNEQASRLLDYSKFGLFFNLDLLGYGLMALSTFFAGLTIEADTKADKWLKCLLIIHGIFFISCLIMPMLGLFSADVQCADWVGIAALEVWCVYFIPIGVLSLIHFNMAS